jgi:5-methylcytosine-specific restriction endonuclease McrA
MKRRKKIRDWSEYKVRTESLTKLGFSTYQDYLNSDLWNGIRNAVMDRDSRTCGICRQTANHVHHFSYTQSVLLGLELDQLVSLCTQCHRRLEFTINGYKRTPTETRGLYDRRRKRAKARIKKMRRQERKGKPSWK